MIPVFEPSIGEEEIDAVESLLEITSLFSYSRP